MKRILVVFSSVFFFFQLEGQNTQVHITRDHMSPLWHKFDPSTLPDIWVSKVESSSEEMPLPSGIDNELRKKIDQERAQKIKHNLSNRKVVNGTKTPLSQIDPTIIKNTDGLTGSGTPNDNHIAVANDGKFIAVMNTLIRVHNDTGKPIKSWSLENFVNTKINPNNKIDPFPILNRTYDPRVIYDPYTDRFILFFMHGTTDLTSFIVVGFSTAGDPTKPWNVYKIPGNPINDTVWSDYPIVSQTKEDVYFTVNILGNGTSWEEGFREAVIWQLRKEDGYNGDSLHKNCFSGIKFNGQSVRSICPVQNGPMPDGIDNYFVSVRPIDKSNDSVFLHHITNTQKSGKANFELKLLKANIPYGFPSSALQPDTGLRYKLRTNDARALTGIRNGNQIQYMQNSMNFKTLQAHLMHSTIYNIQDANPKVVSELCTHDTLDFGYPAMAFANNKENDPSVIITSVYSSLNHFPGMGMLYRNRYGEYSNYIKIKQGTSLINYFGIKPDEQRWGDYEGIQAKYNEPGVFYAVGSYGKSTSMYSFISKIKLKDNVLNQPVESVRIFPIPSDNGIINLELQSTNTEIYTGEMYNMNGQSISDSKNHYKIHFQVEEGTHIYRIHTHNLAPGNYQLKIYTESGKFVVSKKIIIQ
jgi:hypothetical protein